MLSLQAEAQEAKQDREAALKLVEERNKERYNSYANVSSVHDSYVQSL